LASAPEGQRSKTSSRLSAKVVNINDFRHRRFVVVAWAFDEVHPTANEARDRLRSEDAVAPALWWFEVRNALVQGERRGRFDQSGTGRFLRGLSRFAISIDRVPEERSVFDLARRHRLSVYDAAYLELARRRGFPLATLDNGLDAAARAEAVPLVER
jgi:predicted nucleic acid-binding protein